MDSLLNQFDNLIKEWKFETKQYYRIKANEIRKIGEDIFRGSVPIDTERLKQTVKGEVIEMQDAFEIRIFIKNINIPYPKKSINSIQLGLILERGRGKSGVLLRRTKSNSLAALGEPTANFFAIATDKWQKEASKILGL